MTDKQFLDFSFIIASSVHDMKNSLSMLLHSLDEINQTLREREPRQEDQLLTGRMATLQYEAARVNNDLVQLLSLYKLNENMLRANVDEHFLTDFLEEQTIRYSPLFESRSVTCKISCDENLAGYFDRDLVGGVINNILANSIRYCKSAIQISAHEHQNWLVISIRDDGIGFPEAMLSQPETTANSTDFVTGSTHLGIYFAQRIAQLHTQGERQGKIVLSNDKQGNGGKFSLWLP